MLDIRLVRSSPDVIRADLKKRNDTEKLAWVDDLLKKDVRSRELKMETDVLRQRRNTIAREINAARKAGQDANVLLTEAANLPQKIKDWDTEQEEIAKAIHHYLMRLPNILHESVPVGKDDSENVEIRRVGTQRTFDFDLKNHGQLATEQGWADFERATKISSWYIAPIGCSLVAIRYMSSPSILYMTFSKSSRSVTPSYDDRLIMYGGITGV